MSESPMEKHQLWSPNSFAVFKEAELQRAEFDLQCCLRLSARPLDLALKGHLLDVFGNTAVFVVREQRTLQSKGKADELSCSFSFSLEQEMPSGISERTGFHGRGSILEVEKNADGTLKQLQLRLSRQYVTRRLRRDKRVLWNADITSLLVLMVAPGLPPNRKSLRVLLQSYFKNAEKKHTELVNISAGGACLCVEEELAKKALMANELYLFFFAPKSADKDGRPYILTGKKVGLCRDICTVGAALRMRFLHELNWDKSQTNLYWTNIENSGSPRLRRDLCARVDAGVLSIAQ